MLFVSFLSCILFQLLCFIIFPGIFAYGYYALIMHISPDVSIVMLYFLLGIAYIFLYIVGFLLVVVFGYRLMTGHSLLNRGVALEGVMHGAFAYNLYWFFVVYLCIAIGPLQNLEFWADISLYCKVLGDIFLIYIDPALFWPTPEEEIYVYAAALPEVRRVLNIFRSEDNIVYLEECRISIEDVLGVNFEERDIRKDYMRILRHMLLISCIVVLVAVVFYV